MSGKFHAHTLQNPDGSPRPEEDWEPLEDHLRAVADLARTFAAKFGAAEWGYLAGLWHDLGKYQRRFQLRLRDSSIHAPHAGVGAVLAAKRGAQLGVLIAFAIAGHHAGLANLTEAIGPQPLQEVIAEYEFALAEVIKAANDAIIQAPIPDAPAWISKAVSLLGSQDGRQVMAFFTRMLFSSLVDADRLATAEFYATGESKATKSLSPKYDPIPVLRDRLDGFIDRKARIVAKTSITPINVLRAKVLAACRTAAIQPPGVFSLTVPTGGGKTLAGMSFALRHAAIHGHERVIVVIPFTSIITQNAQRYKEALSEDGVVPDPRNVLEHHSGIDEQARQEENAEQELRRQAAAENWDAPIIVTTTVQFFESLFSNHPSRCRKLHRIAGSVVILDEVQTLPPSLLMPILHSLRELVEHYGCSLVLSTATPPALQQRIGLQAGLEGVVPIVPDVRDLFNCDAARRVQVEWRVDRETSFDTLAAEISVQQQSLAIVHRRQDARELCELLPKDGRYHLSALMCPAHRMAKLAAVEHCLKEGQTCRLISTQLIEAGVDVDFPIVYRALAGVDSLAQAAGRCDREGKLTLKAGRAAGRFIVFLASTSPPGETLRKALQTTQTLLKLQDHEARLSGGLDILNPEHANLFFEEFYRAHQLDAKHVLRSLAALNFANVARDFKMIADEGMRAIAVPWGDGLKRAERYRDKPSRETARALQPFLVQVNLRYFEHIAKRGLIEVSSDSIGLPTSLFGADWYSEEFGLEIDAESPISADVMIA